MRPTAKSILAAGAALCAAGCVGVPTDQELSWEARRANVGDAPDYSTARELAEQALGGRALPGAIIRDFYVAPGQGEPLDRVRYAWKVDVAGPGGRGWDVFVLEGRVVAVRDDAGQVVEHAGGGIPRAEAELRPDVSPSAGWTVIHVL